MAPVLNIRLFRLDDRGSGWLQENRPYSLELGSVSLGGQGLQGTKAGEKQGETAQWLVLLVSEIVMCPQKNFEGYAYSGRTFPPRPHCPTALAAQVQSSSVEPQPSPFQASLASWQAFPSPKSALANGRASSVRRPPVGPGFPRHVSGESGLHLGLCLPIGSARNSLPRPCTRVQRQPQNSGDFSGLGGLNRPGQCSVECDEVSREPRLNVHTRALYGRAGDIACRRQKSIVLSHLEQARLLRWTVP
jgi:hypothetical protein